MKRHTESQHRLVDFAGSFLTQKSWVVTLDGKQSHDTWKKRETCIKSASVSAAGNLRSEMSQDIVRPLTPDEEVATNDKHYPNRSQHEPSTVSVVFVAHEADPTHWVSIHL